METAGKTLDEKELSDAMKETGLGTPATRASIIEVLLKREYIVRNAKNLVATDKGIRLIEVVHPEVKSPAMTGQWEAYLKRIQRGEAKLGPFLAGSKSTCGRWWGRWGDAGCAPRRREERCRPRLRNRRLGRGDRGVAETCGSDAPQGRSAPGDPHRAFGFPRSVPNQEEVCRAVMEGEDVLLVMPTGAGKSLCYQLPGVARGGTTLVISPLIALMEDQVAKLRELGLCCGAHPLGPGPRGVAASVRRLSERQAAIPLHRAGAAARAGFSGDAGETQAVAGCDR